MEKIVVAIDLPANIFNQIFWFQPSNTSVESQFADA